MYVITSVSATTQTVFMKHFVSVVYLLMTFWAYYFSISQCFTLMGPLINKSHNVFYDGNWVTKGSKWYSTGRKTEILSHLHTMNFGQLVDPLRISHLNCLKCERRTVKVLRGKLTGDLATLSAIDPGVCLSNPTPVPLSCLQHPSSQRQHPPSRANSVPSKPSIKMPVWPRPLSPPSAAHKPLAAPQTRQPASAPGSGYRLVLMVMGVCLPIV